MSMLFPHAKRAPRTGQAMAVQRQPTSSARQLMRTDMRQVLASTVTVAAYLATLTCREPTGRRISATALADRATLSGSGIAWPVTTRSCGDVAVIFRCRSMLKRSGNGKALDEIRILQRSAKRKATAA
ncbi:hypothetical protein [Xanthomonas cannabis]|uniref:hypothetical protein n=1 Tax=Xanthomonas cannabis TaxID=1885674 RepID=UPI00160F07A1|nr:hypothetical protein [Xanthomonas cannabis]MBB5520850.1 uncharacterized protein YdeI (YjbR/CyaY-like superfamily) [Xanthomonas cannabis]